LSRLPGRPSLWLHRLGIRRLPAQQSVEWEIDHHLAELVDRLVSEGWTRGDANAEAERRFGDRRRYGTPMARMERAAVARSRVSGVVASVGQSITAALRTTRRHPGFALGIVLTLGLGLGANATMYGIVDRLLLRPPEHIVQPERVRNVFMNRPNPVTGAMSPQAAFSYPDYEDLKAHTRMSVAAWESGSAIVGSGSDATMVSTAQTTASFFPLLGVRPYLGRFYSEEEAAPGSPLTAVLSYERWQRAYGADPDIVGRVIPIDEDRVPVIGVTPPGFTGASLRPTDVFLPLEASITRGGNENVLTGRRYFFAGVVARLDDGVDERTAAEEATQLHKNAHRPEIEAGRYSEATTLFLAPLRANPWEPELSAESRVSGWLMGVSLIVLLIACANVANLLFARVASARREVAVRLALGGSRLRLVAQGVLEATMLALGGGALALAIARWGGGLARSRLLPDFAFPDSPVAIRVVAFTVVVSVFAGLLAGLGPAVQGTRVDVAPDLTDSGRSTTARRSMGRDLLTGAQAALSVVLLVGAGLFVRSLMEVQGLDLGFDTDRIVTAQFIFRGGEPEPVQQRDFFERAARRLATLPEVESVAVTATPFGTSYAIPLEVPGLDSLPRLPTLGPYVFSVTPGYFATAGLAITAGRPILDTDGALDPPVAVVGRTMARLLWPDQDPLGRCLRVGEEARQCTTVVGVVEDASRYGIDQNAYMGYYLPMSQAAALPQESLGVPSALYIRARADADAVVAATTPVLSHLTPEVRWARVSSLRDQLDPEARSWALGAAMFIAFGVLAVMLAAIGLYAVLAFEVARSTREIGIRVALGAERAGLLRSVLYRGGRVGLMGTISGLAIVYVIGPRIADLLFQVSPRDPFVLSAVGGVLLTVCLAASLLPGLRATRVDPMAALKSD